MRYYKIFDHPRNARKYDLKGTPIPVLRMKAHPWDQKNLDTILTIQEKCISDTRES